MSVLASSLADFWVKPPVISASPAGNRVLHPGAEIEAPSSTIANWFCGGCLAESAGGGFEQPRSVGIEPRFTCQAMPFCGFRQRRWPADCLRSAWGQAGTSRSRSGRRRTGLIRNVVRLLVAGELCERGLGRLRSAPIPSPCRAACALPVGSLTRLVRRLRRGGRQRRERACCCRSGWAARPPWSRRRESPRARLGRRFCSGRRRPSPWARAPHAAAQPARPRTQRAERSSAVRPTSRPALSRCTFGTVTISCRSRGDNLGLADAQAVHPVLDDRLGQLQAVGVDRSGVAGGVLRRQGDGGAALEVKAELLGVQALFTAIRVISPATRTPSTIKVRPGCPVVVVATCVKVLKAAVSRSRLSASDRSRQLHGLASVVPSGSVVSSSSRSSSSVVNSVSSLLDHDSCDRLLEHGQPDTGCDLQHHLLVPDGHHGAEHTAAEHHPRPAPTR